MDYHQTTRLEMAYSPNTVLNNGVPPFAIDPALLSMPGPQAIRIDPTNSGLSIEQSVGCIVTGRWHVEGGVTTDLVPQDGPNIPPEQATYEATQVYRNWDAPTPNPNSHPVTLTDPSIDDSDQQYSDCEGHIPTVLRASPSSGGNLLQNPIFHQHVQRERGNQSLPIATSSLPIEDNSLLTIGHPLTIEYLESVVDKPYLQDIIEYIIDSSWYKNGCQEQLPYGELRKAFKNKKSSSSASSPFSAFFVRKPKSGYHCLLCEGRGRTLERALGHSRDHFKSKPINGYTNLNTKKDQERRAGKGKQRCSTCNVGISRQNFSRHTKTKEHKNKARLAQ